MNGLLIKQLQMLGDGAYCHWKDNLVVALKQLNNCPINAQETRLMRMMVPNLQIAVSDIPVKEVQF